MNVLFIRDTLHNGEMVKAGSKMSFDFDTKTGKNIVAQLAAAGAVTISTPETQEIFNELNPQPAAGKK